MTGETDLATLLKTMQPELNPGEYVYAVFTQIELALTFQPLCIFHEKEGVTAIITKAQADSMQIPYSTTLAWITLTVHSSLEAVGLTAAVSHALTEADISCNVVAAFHHDHLFIPTRTAQRAMQVLQELSNA